MVTPKLKDSLLKYIIEQSPEMYLEGHMRDWADLLQTNVAVLESILKQFQQKNFILFTNSEEGMYSIQVEAAAHDYFLNGGHIGEIEKFEMEFKKLAEEIKALQNAIPKNRFEYLTTTVNSLNGFFSIIYQQRH